MIPHCVKLTIKTGNHTAHQSVLGFYQMAHQSLIAQLGIGGASQKVVCPRGEMNGGEWDDRTRLFLLEPQGSPKKQ